jgi:hypothetical protein
MLPIIGCRAAGSCTGRLLKLAALSALGFYALPAWMLLLQAAYLIQTTMGIFIAIHLGILHFYACQFYANKYFYARPFVHNY